MSVNDLASIIAVIGSIMAIIIAWRKTPIEIAGMRSSSDSTDADTAEKYQRIADQAASRALKLNERIGELEGLVNTLRSDMYKLQRENENLRDWADRLVHQVISLGAQPVKIREHKGDTEPIK